MKTRKLCKDCNFKSKKFQFDCDKMKRDKNVRAEYSGLFMGNNISSIRGILHLCFYKNQNEDCSDFTPTLWAKIKGVLNNGK